MEKFSVFRLVHQLSKAIFYLSALTMTMLLTGCVKPPPESLLAREALCEPIGQEGWEQELCVLNIVNHSPYYEISRFFLVSEGHIQELVSRNGIHELLVSPSNRYLALVEDAGEGHPELSVCALDAFLEGRDRSCFAGFNPYPGGVYDLVWQGDVLTFTSEADDPLQPENEGEKYQRYALDAVSGKLRKMGESVPVE